ncbi:hypothetical protein LEP48_01880 [Isoptericola sp. NEAU-Y5]|uniref:Uncharacterized protein n=1 Tax=Isoptericola luteus TaxID=2879484 RepID=A0ABS7ZEA9_9MICO|nr:hypothetical protein [Isoptericola sp. NEAU-Y5]MCA5892100.1 hypothetical protein [Isoptericola sp. NEAU-Y5]
MSSPTPDRTPEPEPAPQADASGEPPAPSTPSTPSAPSTAPGASVPEDEQDLALLVDPERVRRAPRYPAFFTVGAIVGIVAGLWFGTWLAGNVDPSQGDAPLLKPGVFVTVITLGTTTLAVLLAGLAALVADRRSLRRR